MISRIEALNYRCLRDVSQAVQPFQVLVGPNASGKSTFLDVLSFLSKFVNDDLEAAVRARTQNFEDLVWGRSGTRFDLAIEALIPPDLRVRAADGFDTIRYEVAAGLDAPSNAIAILAESVVLKGSNRDLLPPEPNGNNSNTLRIINKSIAGNASFHPEGDPLAAAVGGAFGLGPTRSALGYMPIDRAQYPATTWLKDLLTEGVQRLELTNEALRKPSPPGQGRRLLADGANLPWVVADLAEKAPDRFAAWIAHLQTALPDLQGIQVVTRYEDRSRYLLLQYPDDLAVPSWMASDGTLRLLALTVLAYLPDRTGTYLIEEPETGIHPRAIETIMHSLMGVYDALILVATQSPVILSVVPAAQVLVFARTPAGATDIVRGDQHPALRDWQGEPNLGMLFAGGVLG
ncbi:MAG TPA: AAA family ATPase [Chloroflexia bacterium]|nr:AAA family ATPase [Chloroflexia bacterium]